jgi:hypothetical protein
MRKNFIRIALLAMAIAGTFLVVGSARTSSSSTPCEESMDECCKKKSKAGNEDMIWENLSGQFFSSTSL